MNWSHWEILFKNHVTPIATLDDPAHDLLHFERVVGIAKKLCQQEGAQASIVIPAAWLHDLVIIPKDNPLRNQASRLSAQKAIEFLHTINYPQIYYNDIAHAIEGHSFSANIEVTTLEAKIVQDADRLDGLGAIGIARCFATAGLLKRSFYHSHDPFCTQRQPDDALYTLDHFFKKLFKTAETLKTSSGIQEGQQRIQAMKSYLSQLQTEIESSDLY